MAKDHMSRIEYACMKAVFWLTDFLYPNYIPERVKRFGIKAGKTVIDYGCGPGRYTVLLAEAAGRDGLVYAVDINPYALDDVKKRADKKGVSNIICVQARGLDSGVADGSADYILVIDMFFGIQDRLRFLNELKRISKKGCRLFIDGAGHISMDETRRRIEEAGVWKVDSLEKGFYICSLKE